MLPPHSNDTIYALSSGAGPSGVAVIRVSGRAAECVLRSLATAGVVRPGSTQLLSIRDRNGDLLDRALVLTFRAPASFTGEDVVEFHVHGGRATVAAVLAAIANVPGTRPAEPGEFTLRAVRNGKLDLAQAEALADLVDAETESQRRLAIAGTLDGAYDTYRDWVERLTGLRAAIEAGLDFSDEGDVDDDLGVHRAPLIRLRNDIAVRIAAHAPQEMVRQGFRVALVGAPNVGKSSLLNALARRDVAIVTPLPGTTRDLVEVALDIQDLKVVLTDTAGLRETGDPVEAIGIERARRAADTADLVVLLHEGDPPQIDSRAEVLRVRAKADLLTAPPQPPYVSSRTGAGLDELVTAIAERAGRAGAADTVPVQRRHHALLKECAAALDLAIAESDPVLTAELLRQAGDALGRITGAVDVEDLLGAIFSRFCIGK